MNKNVKINPLSASNDLQKRWYLPVNRIGRITMILAIITNFFPCLFLYIKYGQFPELSTALAGIGAISSAYIAAWFVEPISFFPALGTAGTYMGVLSGSIAQMRVPASMVAKSVAGVKENTQEAEIVGTCGIAGSVFMNLIILTLTAIGGSFIVTLLPEIILNSLTAYILPSIFGAVLAMFTSKKKLPVTFPVLLISICLNLLVNRGMLPIPPWSLMVITILISVFLTRILYKKGWVS